MGTSSHRQRYDVLLRLLREARLSAEIRQVDVAHRLRVPQSWVSKSELGERRMDVIDLIDYLEAIQIRPAAFVDDLMQQLGAKALPAAERRRRTKTAKR